MSIPRMKESTTFCIYALTFKTSAMLDMLSSISSTPSKYSLWLHTNWSTHLSNRRDAIEFAQERIGKKWQSVLPIRK